MERDEEPLSFAIYIVPNMLEGVIETQQLQ